MKKLLLLLSFLSTFSLAGYENYYCECAEGTYLDHISYYGVSNNQITPEGCYNPTTYAHHVEDGRNNFYLTVCTSTDPCDDNETQDTSVYPPVCVPNAPPLLCPANSSPDVNNTSCSCNSPYVDIGTGNDVQCVLPNDVPDENSTKPNGDCEDGYAKNTLGVCKQDSDNDGVPDDEDAYPNDPSKSGGDGEIDTPFCKRGMNDCTPNCVCPKGTLNLLGYTSLCYSFETGEQHVGKFCDTDGTGDEPIDPNAPEECGNPPFIFNLKFQTVVATDAICYDLRRRYADGGVTNGFNYTCPDKTIACYYNLASDNNNTDSTPDTPSSPDSNNTGTIGDTNNTSNPDNNSTGLSDTTNIENKLDSINSALGADGSINKSLVDIGSLVSNASGKNHTDLTNINSTLTNKLDAIKSAIDSKDVAQPTDMTDTNQKLDDINDKLNEGDGTEGDISSSDMKNGASAATSSISSSLSSLISSATGNPPIVRGTGTSSFTANVWGGSVNFDLSMFSNMRQYFDIVWILLLAFINFKIYSIIIRDLLKKL